MTSCRSPLTISGSPCSISVERGFDRPQIGHDFFGRGVRAGHAVPRGA
jgi:hypothetical protein